MTELNDVQYSSEARIFEQYIKYIDELVGRNEELLKVNSVVYDRTDVSDTAVQFDRATFVAENLGLILSAIIMNYHGIVDIVNNAIGLEVGLDDMTTSERFLSRKKMKINNDTSLSIIAGITSFSFSVTTSLLEAANESMLRISMCDKLNVARMKAIKELNNENIITLSVIFNSPAYLLRAICNNDVFYNKLINLIKSFEKEFDIKSFDYYKAKSLGK